MRIPNVLDFRTKIIILHGWSNWISTQGINISVSEAWSVHNLKVKVLQHVNPSASLAMCIRHSCQPFEWFVISAQNKVIPVKVLPKVHDAPYECITLSLHGMEFLQCICQTLVGIGYHLLQFPFFLGQNGSDPFG
jgi:hypothetical protein